MLDPDKLGPIYRNATMLLRPKTGLNDMSIQLDPGTPEPAQPDGGELRRRRPHRRSRNRAEREPGRGAGARSTPTRAATWRSSRTPAAQGLKGRGPDLRALLEASQPTLAQHARA